MNILFGIFGSVIFAFILAIIGTVLDKGKTTFMQKFTSILTVLLVIVIVGSILEMAGCNPDDDPGYPMKYSE